MNATFNLKRFYLLEQYKKQETGRHLLWSAGIVLGICLLCMMYDINKGSSITSNIHRLSPSAATCCGSSASPPACWR